jgi:hypothetical protein
MKSIGFYHLTWFWELKFKKEKTALLIIIWYTFKKKLSNFFCKKELLNNSNFHNYIKETIDNLSLRNISNKLCLVFVERSSIWMNYIVEPYLWNWRSLFWPPRIVCLSSSKYKSPVNCPNPLILKYW